MATDRVGKYFEDAGPLIASSNTPKICAEIKKLATYLQKHQNEVVTDAAKTKLTSTVEMYYRSVCSLCISDVSSLDCLSVLLSTYLQMPEGKLVAAKDKKKTLNWLNDLNGLMNQCENNNKQEGNFKPCSVWSIEDLNMVTKELTLLSTENTEVWKEDFRAANIDEFFSEIVSLRENAEHDCILLHLNDSTETIVSVLVKAEGS
jgi:hypothetical protein